MVSTRVSSYTIVQLVSWQKWNYLRDILQRENTTVFDNRTKNRLPEEHILHLACQHQAPQKIVELLAEKYPQSASCAEKKGRYPIHIACAKGLKPSVIDFLIKSHPPSSGASDEYGKTPLMYACESYEINYRTIPANAYKSPEKSLATVVKLLLDEVPESANVEDHDGYNAVEYAIESCTDICTVKMIQHACRDNWRSMRKLHQGMSHEELRESFTSLSASFSSSLDLSSGYLLDRASQETKTDYGINVLSRIDIPDPEKKVHVARTA